MSSSAQPHVAPDDFDSAPDWFVRSIESRPRHTDIEVDGCRVHLRLWGDRVRPTLILVHGGAAHSGWWDHIAPYFAETHYVVAIDLSGHGDSGRRQSYREAQWGEEVAAAASFANPHLEPTIVGHSMGGWVTVAAAVRDDLDPRRVVIIDSPLRQSPINRVRQGRPDGYASRDEILARFVTVPSQDSTLTYVQRHVALESIVRRDARWFWKFDPTASMRPELRQAPEDVNTLRRLVSEKSCPITFLRSEQGLVPPLMAEQIRNLLAGRGTIIELAEAGHHPMLDQPLALVSALRVLIASG